MGYTHYYEQKRNFTNKEWNRVLQAFNVILDHFKETNFKETKIVLQVDQADETCIIFNGIGHNAHETFVMNKDNVGFNFCKTARKDYDVVVCLLLLVAHCYVVKEGAKPVFSVGSDGEWEEEWAEARDLYHELFKKSAFPFEESTEEKEKPLKKVKVKK